MTVYEQECGELMRVIVQNKAAHEKYVLEKEAEIEQLKKDHAKFLDDLLATNHKKNLPMRPCIGVRT